jgi:single-strand DNA-binding protein
MKSLQMRRELSSVAEEVAQLCEHILTEDHCRQSCRAELVHPPCKFIKPHRRRLAMPNRFEGVGNLGKPPEGKNVSRKDGQGDFFVATMRVFFGRYKRNEKDEIEQSGGFWREVEQYGQKGQDAFRLLRQGARVLVIGEEQEFTGTDDNGNKVQVFKVMAEHVTLVLSRIESIKFAPPREQHTEARTPEEAAAAA